ncbi:PD40 domain-containing protein [Caldimonas brevitalea]|uniref:TolB protein n=1 Tax=Caldimonas brevitalea TaxID=413882 RepID=A0A0G3BQ77_9BURK|nr:PD40 domain-containing protein [Caldimonas brevitalea]AKJ30138.1 hypothetical protein AAW51_3447 [Caldimonas brevitalea]
MPSLIPRLLGLSVTVLALAGCGGSANDDASAASLETPPGVDAPRCRADGACRLIGFSGPASAQNPCFSPDGRQLVFTRWQRGYNRAPAGLWTVGSTGGTPRAIIDDGADNVNLPGSCWSRAGRIAYSSDSVGESDEIWTAAADGSQRRRITTHRGPPYIEPSFSPDGTQLVFEASASETSAELWKVNADGGGLTRLSHGGADREPNWSPSGELIVFQRLERGDEWALYTMRPDGSDVRRVTPPGWSCTDASFSPDGQRLVFSATPTEGDGAQIAVVPASGGTLRPVTRSGGYNGAPSWSPDGLRIAFEASDDPDATRPTALWIINAP